MLKGYGVNVLSSMESVERVVVGWTLVQTEVL